MSNTSKRSFWQQDCCSRIYLRFLPFAFVTRAGSECISWGVMCHAGHVGTAPGYLQGGCQALESKMLLPGLRENTSQQLRAKPEHNISVWTDFSPKGFDCWFSKGCFNEIYLLYGNINSVFRNCAQKINFSRWKLEDFYSGRLLQCWGEG